jgi:hypothetical protein
MNWAAPREGLNAAQAHEVNTFLGLITHRLGASTQNDLRDHQICTCNGLDHHPDRQVSRRELCMMSKSAVSYAT